MITERTAPNRRQMREKEWCGGSATTSAVRALCPA